jgi:hypothetical protein
VMEISKPFQMDFQIYRLSPKSFGIHWTKLHSLINWTACIALVDLLNLISQSHRKHQLSKPNVS